MDKQELETRKTEAIEWRSSVNQFAISRLESALEEAQKMVELIENEIKQTEHYGSSIQMFRELFNDVAEAFQWLTKDLLSATKGAVEANQATDRIIFFDNLLKEAE